MPATGQGYVPAGVESSSIARSFATQPPAESAPPAVVDGRLLIATTRTSSRPHSDLPSDYRLAWWDSRGLQPLELPGEDGGILDAAAQPGGRALIVIVGGTTLIRAADDGSNPVDLLPTLRGARPGDVQAYLSVGWAGPDRLLVRQTPPAGISFVDPSGQSRSRVAVNGLNPAVTRDGQHIALGYAGGRSYYSIFVADEPFVDVRKLTNDEVLEALPAWSFDGAWLAYTAQVRAQAGSPPGWAVRIVRSSGADEQTILVGQFGMSYSSLQWSPDGLRIAFTRYDEATHTRQIGVINRDGSDMALIGDGAASDRVLDWIP